MGLAAERVQVELPRKAAQNQLLRAKLQVYFSQLAECFQGSRIHQKSAVEAQAAGLRFFGPLVSMGK